MNNTFNDKKLTPRAEVVFALAYKVAQKFGHSYIGAEHLLLAMTYMDTEPVGEILKGFGATRKTVADKLGWEAPQPKPRYTTLELARMIDEWMVEEYGDPARDLGGDPEQRREWEQMSNALRTFCMRFFAK